MSSLSIWHICAKTAEHIAAATEDRPLSTAFLLNLVILVHHLLNFVDL